LGDRLNQLGDPNSGSCLLPAQGWDNRTGTHGELLVQHGSFSVSAARSIRQHGGNSLAGPAFQQWNLSARKMIPVDERMSLQFRAELNIFNNVNFRLPANHLSSSNFGQIQAAQPGARSAVRVETSFLEIFPNRGA